MRGTIERAALVHARVQALELQKRRRNLAGLSALSASLSILLFGAIGMLSGSGHSPPPGQMAGASLLSGSAGGYVLVAVLSFSAAVAFTTLCYRLKRRHDAPRGDILTENEKLEETPL